MDISYKGTNYHGWQTQPNGMTVQEKIEKALAVLLKGKIAITGSGRTDAGVHAKQQIGHFDFDQIDREKLVYKLNSFLPNDIAINSIRPVVPDANARFSASSRTYHYHIHQSKNPFNMGGSYYFKPELNIDEINESCEIIKNWQNFECFSRVHTEVNHFNCDIFEAVWIQEKNKHVFKVSANRFLRGMVRAMVGTLLDIGLGKKSISDLHHILASNDRKLAGRAVPPEGLFLQEVSYPTEIYLDL